MGRSKIDRTGEERLNSFGSKMIISKYNNKNDIDVYFPEYKYTINHVYYSAFKKGEIKCLYEPRVFGIGYLGKGKYKTKENGKHTKCYDAWKNMLQRCYDNKYKEKYPTYKGCKVCEEWHNFQNFASWYNDNYYEIPNDFMCLDKDILFKGNKIYSPETCVFVSNEINSLFTKCNKSRGDLPIGVYYFKSDDVYVSRCSFGNKLKHLGRFDTPQEAFQVYKEYKEKYIKQLANKYKEYIPQKLYEAMYNYEVEIDD